jgi:hypothetical protein
MGIGLLMTTMWGLRRARTVEDLRLTLFAGRWVEKLMPIGTVLVLAAGVWMAFMKDDAYTWHSAWIITAAVLVVVFSINGALNIGRKMERLGREAFGGSGGKLNPQLAALATDPALHYSAWAGIGVIFSFIVLMVEKPGWLGSILWVLGGMLAGTAVNLLVAKTAAVSKDREPLASRTARTSKA